MSETEQKDKQQPADSAAPTDDSTAASPSPARDEPDTATSAEPSPARDTDTSQSPDRHADNRSPSQDNNHTAHTKQSTAKSPSPSRRYPPIATVSYPSRQPNMQVADFLDPSKPLVKSTIPLTQPKGPSFVEEDKSDERSHRRVHHKMRNAVITAQINSQRTNERKYLKAQYEFEREKKLAERAIYHRERCAQWSQRLGASPLAVDLVADNERIEEEAYVREREDHRRKVLAERKKRKVKNEIIVKALAEVPLLEEARRQKREMLDEERRQRAMRDVQRVEAIQERKLRDTNVMNDERQAKLDQRIMSSTAKRT